MDRFDLYSGIHKGIRRILFETSLAVAATDFADAEASAAACRSVERMRQFLDEHALHEDEVIMPVLGTLAPELFTDLRAEHAKVEGLQREVAAIVLRLGESAECERVSLGRRLEDRLGRLVAAQLTHLAHEESDANRVLWAHRDDPQLMQLSERIVVSISPTRLCEWYALVLPAMNRRERSAMLSGMRAGMPAQLFDEVTAGAREALGEVAWNSALAALAN